MLAGRLRLGTKLQSSHRLHIRCLHHRFSMRASDTDCVRVSRSQEATKELFSGAPSTKPLVFGGHSYHHDTRLTRSSARSFSTALSTSESSIDDDDFKLTQRQGLRNVAIIAHVDHGKTTLVDKLLSATSRSSESLDRLMDSGELEKERGITITSKVTRLEYQSKSSDESIIVNVVDTPGHADFSGEVDRILSMVDGVCLLVDAAEGPMTQTKYVLSRSLALGLKPIVVLNKADRPDAQVSLESGETESSLLDLFDALGASDEQMDYPTLYASARNGWVTADLSLAQQIAINRVDENLVKEEASMDILLNCILEHVPEPAIRTYTGEPASEPFSLAAVTVGYDSYKGRTCTGRIVSGSVGVDDKVMRLKRGESRANLGETSTLSGIFVNKGISRTPLETKRAIAGDIVTLYGVPDDMQVGDTLTGQELYVSRPIETPPLAPPTLSMEFGANNGPLGGKEGTIVTSSKIRDRLFKETDNNVTLSVTKSETDSDKTVVYARGELQLGILVEQMRREGYELMISPPQILLKECPETKKTLEPFEELIVDVDSEFSGTVVSALTGERKAILLEMTENSDGKSRLKFDIPSRGLLGFSTEIASATKGTAVVNHCYVEDRAYAGPLGLESSRSKIVSLETGKATTFSLANLAQRGTLFIQAGDMVYQGMIIGENSKTKASDMDVNPVKAKELTNMRTQAKDEALYVPPPKRMTVEEMIGYMGPDEIIEVTPQNIRLRKAVLDPKARARAAKGKKK